MWPRTAPPTVKAAVLGLYLMVVLLVANIVTVMAVAPSGEVLVEDLLIGVGFVAIVVGICRRALWARYAGVVVAAVFALGALSQFQGGIPGVVVVVGIVQLVVLVAVVVLLLVPLTGDWFRGLV
ncbi:hypothetical protein ACXR2U_14230 [Jatrophihabitans sp. YIM 134969]